METKQPGNLIAALFIAPFPDSVCRCVWTCARSALFEVALCPFSIEDHRVLDADYCFQGCRPFDYPIHVDTFTRKELSMRAPPVLLILLCLLLLAGCHPAELSSRLRSF